MNKNSRNRNDGELLRLVLLYFYIYVYVSSSLLPERKDKTTSIISFSHSYFLLISTSDKTQFKPRPAVYPGSLSKRHSFTPFPAFYISAPGLAHVNLHPAPFSSSFSLLGLISCIGLIISTGHKLAPCCYLPSLFV